MAVSEVLSQAIRSRAHGRCQYCLMHESLQGATFHVEHVIPKSKGGESALENLALACPGCLIHFPDGQNKSRRLIHAQFPVRRLCTPSCCSLSYCFTRSGVGFGDGDGENSTSDSSSTGIFCERGVSL